MSNFNNCKAKIKGYYFRVGFNWPAKKKSILEISSFIVNLIRELSAFDERFDILLFENKLGINQKFDTDDPQIINKFSQEIIKSVKSDILINDNVTDFNEHFSREFGFTFSFSFYNHLIKLSGRIGSSDAEGLVFNFSKDFEETIDWFYELMQVCVRITKSYYCVMQTRMPQVYRNFNDLKFALGLITYYSKEILTDTYMLQDIEHYYLDDGCYFILSSEEVTKNKDSFENFTGNLILRNNILKEIFPNFLL